MPELLLIVLFFVIAILYSSIGFGGGSSYLALLSLYFADFEIIRSTALICNVAVVLGSTLIFINKGLVDWKRFLPFVAVSIPAAFIGAQFKLSQQLFFVLLGLALILSAIMLLRKAYNQKSTREHYPKAIPLAVGAGVGGLSGLVGIGGGIFLSPLLNLMQWDTAKRIAALASFFILVNSLAGLGGLWVSKALKVELPLLYFLVAAVVAGGQIGSRLSIHLLKPSVIKILTACLVLYVGLRLVLWHTLALKI